jgi:3-oxoacyl-[acyl-carrier protein] reductase
LSETGRGKNYHILINYTSNQAAAEETLQGVEELGSTGEILKFDVSNAEETQNVLNNGRKKSGFCGRSYCQ